MEHIRAEQKTAPVQIERTFKFTNKHRHGKKNARAHISEPQSDNPPNSYDTTAPAPAPAPATNEKPEIDTPQKLLHLAPNLK